jgi:hypothetical protein
VNFDIVEEIQSELAAGGNGNANGNGNGNGNGPNPQEDQWLACETPSGKTYKIKAVNKAWIQEKIKNGELVSGETELLLDGETTTIDETTGEIDTAGMPPGLAKKLAKRNRKLAVTTGDRSVLVVRVEAGDGINTSASKATLSDSVFGTNGDPVNLKSQYSACSHNQLRFKAADNKPGAAGTDSIVDGAVTVSISTLTSEGDATMRNAISAQLNTQFGVSHPTQLANHLMYCLPPGTMSGIAYAFVNSWMSVYSDNWCQYVSGQMHELGHNLNLAHSNEAGTYKDQSGMMGYSYGQSNAPEMCFNAAKSWQLPWYNQRKMVIEQGGSYSGELASITEDPTDISQPPMLIKINNSSSSTDHYINFNYKSSFNSGTVEGGNQVLIVTAGAEGNGYAESELVAKLSALGVYTADVNGETLEVTINSISGSRANVDICLGTGCLPATPSPTKSPTSTPTKAPTKNPTSAPNQPTKAPTKNPTSAPNQPTKAPTKNPTSAPTKNPTSAPNQPTKTPTKNPTSTPVPPPPVDPCSQFTGGGSCRRAPYDCEWVSGVCSSTGGSPPPPSPPSPTPPSPTPPSPTPSGCSSTSCNICSGGGECKAAGCTWSKGTCTP